jgi:hypothetical protein
MTGELPRRIPARRGFSLSYRGKTLLSLMDPIAQAERLAAELPVKDRTLYFCPSPLYGYGLGTLLERLGRGSAILCVETDPRLMELAGESLGPLLGPPEGRESRLALVRPGGPAELCAFVRERWGGRTFRRVEALRITAGWRLDEAAYGALEAALVREIALDWGNALTLVKLGRRYARNALRNLALIPRSPPLSALSFGDRPLLVLGAGPSLDEFLPALLRFFGPAARRPETRPFGVICADTVLPVLRDWEIRPDLAVALESQVWNLRDFIGLGDWKPPLAMDLSAFPATGGVLGGEVVLFSTPWTELSFFRRLEGAGLLPERLPPLGSVGLSAAALALRLSSGPLLTAGLDFSFTPDRYHARSSPGHRDRLNRQNRFQGVLNVEAAFRPGAGAARSKSGLPVRTDPALKNYRGLFEREFAGLGRFRDSGGTGLPLGLEVLSPEGAFALLSGAGSGPGRPAQAEPGEGRGFAAGNGAGAEEKRRRLERFIREERESLLRLRDILSGAAGAGAEELETLLDRNDLLWAHFPECAAAGGRRPAASDLSFLKRVRVEIDPALRLLDTGWTSPLPVESLSGWAALSGTPAWGD